MLELYRTKKEIIAWLKEWKINNYTLIKNREYGYVVDVHGSVIIAGTQLSQLRVKFNHINGFFSIHRNKLISLKGCPESVSGFFSCEVNRLTSLEYSPKMADSLSCAYNKIVSLEGLSPKIEILTASHNRLTSLKGIQREKMIRLDVSNNKLKTLEGAPKAVEKEFICLDNRLSSLKGCPESIKGNCLIDLAHLKDYSYLPPITPMTLAIGFDKKLPQQYLQFNNMELIEAFKTINEKQKLVKSIKPNREPKVNIINKV